MPDMLEFMKQLREHVIVNVVGGFDVVKITLHLGKSVFTDYNYVFSKNGLVAHKNGELIGTQMFQTTGHPNDNGCYIGRLSHLTLKQWVNPRTYYELVLDIFIELMV